jgi:hypothetical protein
MPPTAGAVPPPKAPSDPPVFGTSIPATAVEPCFTWAECVERSSCAVESGDESTAELGEAEAELLLAVGAAGVLEALGDVVDAVELADAALDSGIQSGGVVGFAVAHALLAAVQQLLEEGFADECLAEDAKAARAAREGDEPASAAGVGAVGGCVVRVRVGRGVCVVGA